MKSQKMRVFYWSLLTLGIFNTYNVILIKSEPIFIAIVWGIISLAGLAITGKFMDDWQRGKNFVKDLQEKT